MQKQGMEPNRRCFRPGLRSSPDYSTDPKTDRLLLCWQTRPIPASGLTRLNASASLLQALLPGQDDLPMGWLVFGLLRAKQMVFRNLYGLRA
jgi:hypothetical protein